MRDPDGAPITDVTSMAVGETSACAVRSSGELLCWGLNEYGQLGLGFEDDEAPRPPAPVLHLEAVSAVDVGGRQVCAIAGGTLSCWGRDGDGELGNGD